MAVTSALLRAATASLAPVSTEVSVTLPVPAAVAYEVFTDAAETPRWLSAVQSAHVLERTTAGRPRAVAFRAAFDRATLGYVLDYDHEPEALTVRWAARAGSALTITGQARFAGLSSRACLMWYRLALDLPIDPVTLALHYDGHAASAVVGDFREHLRRLA